MALKKNTLKVKKSAVGASIVSSKIGRITVTENHADLLFKIGRFDLLEGLPQPKKLTTRKSNTKKDANNKQSDGK